MTRGDAALELLKISDRLTAWAESAKIVSRTALPGTAEEKANWNQYVNYLALANRLGLVAQELDGCGTRSTEAL